MNAFNNPFSPGAGTPPPEFVGREDIITKARIAMARIKMGRPEKSLLMIGLRGVGKTVLLNKIYNYAQQDGYEVVMIESNENLSFPEQLIPYLRQLLLNLDSRSQINESVKKSLRVLKSFVSGIKLSYEGYELGVDINPEKGTGDSGNLEVDLTELFIAVGDAAASLNTAVAFVIDEMQYLSEEELSSLIMATHKISQRSLPIFVIGAGLPQLRGKAGNAKSYAERLFDYPEIGQLEDQDAIKALQEPFLKEGVTFNQKALETILEVTKKFPYFIQEWGYQLWLIAEEPTIELKTVEIATKTAIERLDKNFFMVRFDRLTVREKQYLRAMAELGSEQHRSGDIAEVLGVGVQNIAPFRSKLISKGMIYSPSYGDTQFTVPLFGDFIKRVMPMLEKIK